MINFLIFLILKSLILIIFQKNFQKYQEKLNHLKEQYQWLNKGSILILAYLSDYPEKTQCRKYIQNDTFNWEGPIIDLTGGKKQQRNFNF